MTPDATPSQASGLDTQNAKIVSDAELDEGPEHVPVNAWVTMGIFAVFVIAFGTCASTFMFN